MRLSSRLSNLTESKTLAITAKAQSMRAEGKDVISLSAGEPDFPTPTLICEAGIQAIRDGKTRYTAAAGIPELRDAVARSLERDEGLEYERSEICITPSVKPAVSLALMAILDPGEEIVIPTPYWVSYPDMVHLAGGTPRILETRVENGFLPTETELREALSGDKVRGILLNTPSNPTGIIWPEERLGTLVGICREHGVWILSDEIYSRVICDGQDHVSPASVPGGHECSLVIDGLSKAFSMTGWRLGWVAGPSGIVSSISAMQSHLLGNAPTISQHAAVEALGEEARSLPEVMREAFTERRDLVVAALEAMPGVHCLAPAGAFYAFPDMREVLEARGIDDIQLATALLEEAHVALVPGSAFGTPGHLRLSFATSNEELREALDRITRWLQGAA